MKNSPKHKTHPDKRRVNARNQDADAQVKAAQLHRDLIEFDRGEPDNLRNVVSERLKEGETN